MENNKNSNTLPLVIIFLVIIALVGGAYWFGKNSILRNEPEEEIAVVRDTIEEEVSEPEEVVVEETAEEVTEEPTAEVEESNESVIETLKLLFAQKYEKRVEDVTVTISQREGDYIVGGVKFADEIAGAYVLAAKVNEAWKIVFDGNGNFTCDVVNVVDFPVTLAPECWDDSEMKMVYR